MDSYQNSFRSNASKSNSLKSLCKLPRPSAVEAAPSIPPMRLSSRAAADFPDTARTPDTAKTPDTIVERHSIVVICTVSIVLLVAGSLAFPYLTSASRTLAHPFDSALPPGIGSTILPLASAAHKALDSAVPQDLGSAQSFEPVALVAAALFLVLATLDKINDKINDKIIETRNDENLIHESIGSPGFGAVAFEEAARALPTSILRGKRLAAASGKVRLR